MALTCDLFCSVVDNLGDVGVCWRLARQLAAEHGWHMRLWLDDPAPMTQLRPGFDPVPDRQTLDGVDIRRWSPRLPDVAPGQVVIEAFACELPPSFVEAMAAAPKAPVWINLEYLSAEDWVTGCHGLPSRHPRLPLTKYFFFPGFVAGTGGLLREEHLPPPPPRQPHEELRISLFCYENPALPPLLDAWRDGIRPVRVRVADGLPRRQVAGWLGSPLAMGEVVRRGNLHLEAAPFLPQSDYDAWLAAEDLNFVRGEDSFVRAQWAERPFVWQSYPQDEEAHFAKLEAFLGRYARSLDPGARGALTRFWAAWNGRGDVAAAWPGFLDILPVLERHGPLWAREIAAPGNLAGNLVRFCAAQL